MERLKPGNISEGGARVPEVIEAVNAIMEELGMIPKQDQPAEEEEYPEGEASGHLIDQNAIHWQLSNQRTHVRGTNPVTHEIITYPINDAPEEAKRYLGL